jgi:hypothetical protein
MDRKGTHCDVIMIFIGGCVLVEGAAVRDLCMHVSELSPLAGPIELRQWQIQRGFHGFH